MSELIISVSGLRGIVGDSLTDEIAVAYARAFSQHLSPSGSLVLTRDGRANGPPLSASIQSGLTSVGRDVLDAGVTATPTTGVLVRERQAAGGIQLTASHNPAPYNGMKLFGADGRVVPAGVGEKVRKTFQEASNETPEPGHEGVLSDYGDTITAHWEKIAPRVDVDKIRSGHIRVLLDANHGSGSVLGRHLLEKLGCEVSLRGGTADGRFAHDPEPTAENLSELSAEVPGKDIDIAFCQDPDADRLAVIDAQGRYLGEEYTLALCVDHLLHKQPGAVVTNCSTSRMSEDLAQRHEVPFSRSAVGEANVVDEMLRTSAVIGGEGNGGVIDPNVGLVRDSFIAMAYLLEAMVTRQMSVADLAAEMPRYRMSKRKLTFPGDRLGEGQDAVRRHFTEAAATKPDGLRLDWPDRWLLLRASNTEPIIRIMAEAADQKQADLICREAEQVLLQLSSD